MTDLSNTDDAIVFFHHEGLKRPGIRIERKKSGQVVIFLRTEHNEHLTLHRDKKTGEVILTHWSPELAHGTWNKMKVEVARHLEYGNPEKHEHYISHRPIVAYNYEVPPNGEHLTGRRLNIENAKPKAKYDDYEQIVVELPDKECMIDIVLSMDHAPVFEPDAPHIETEFGGLYFFPNKDDEPKAA